MRYRYKAYAAGGKLEMGEVDAPARTVAVAKLRSQGLLVESIRLAPVIKLNWNAELGRPKLNLRALSILFNQLAMLITGGVPVLQALQVLGNNTRGPMGTVLRGMVKEVESGQPLSKAMAAQGEVFPRVAVHVVSVSELAGELDEGLKLLAEQLDAEDQIARKFKSALIYPSIVIFMAFSLAVFMTLFIVPRYSDMFRQLGAELPEPTQILLAVSDFVQSYWLLVVGLPVLGTVSSLLAMRRSEAYRIWVHRWLLKVAVFGNLIRNRETARYTRTLGTMMKSGVPVLSAAQASADLVENGYMATQLNQVPAAIANGATLGKAIKEAAVLPSIMAELIVVGEVIGNVDTTLKHVADFSDADVKQTVERLTAILEPFLIILMGLIVLAVVVPLLLPMFDIYSKIR